MQKWEVSGITGCYGVNLSPSHSCFECSVPSLWGFRRWSLASWSNTCIHSRMGACMCTGTRVLSCSPEADIKGLLQELSTLCFWEWISHWTQSLYSLARLAGIMGVCCYTWLFTWELGIGTQVLRLVWRALYLLSHLATLVVLVFLAYVVRKTIVFQGSWMKNMRVWEAGKPGDSVQERKNTCILGFF